MQPLSFEKWLEQQNRVPLGQDHRYDPTQQDREEYQAYVEDYEARQSQQGDSQLGQYLLNQGVEFDFSQGGNWNEVYEGLGGSTAMDNYNNIQDLYGQSANVARLTGSQNLLNMTSGQGLASINRGFGAAGAMQQQGRQGANQGYQNQLFSLGMNRKGDEVNFFDSLSDDIANLSENPNNPPDWTYNIT